MPAVNPTHGYSYFLRLRPPKRLLNWATRPPVSSIRPDLFVEGSGVVADGRLGPDRVFVADSLLAKHDENYVPRELADIDMSAAAQTKDTLVP